MAADEPKPVLATSGLQFPPLASPTLKVMEVKGGKLANDSGVKGRLSSSICTRIYKKIKSWVKLLNTKCSTSPQRVEEDERKEEEDKLNRNIFNRNMFYQCKLIILASNEDKGHFNMVNANYFNQRQQICLVDNGERQKKSKLPGSCMNKNHYNPKL